jgi:hypothetical protein
MLWVLKVNGEVESRLKPRPGAAWAFSAKVEMRRADDTLRLKLCRRLGNLVDWLCMIVTLSGKLDKNK